MSASTPSGSPRKRRSSDACADESESRRLAGLVVGGGDAGLALLGLDLLLQLGKLAGLLRGSVLLVVHLYLRRSRQARRERHLLDSLHQGATGESDGLASREVTHVRNNGALGNLLDPGLLGKERLELLQHVLLLAQQKRPQQLGEVVKPHTGGLQLVNQRGLVLADDRKGIAETARALNRETASAADAVRVGGHRVGNVKLDHIVDGGEVNAASAHVSGEDAAVILLGGEASELLVALQLALLAVPLRHGYGGNEALEDLKHEAHLLTGGQKHDEPLLLVLAEEVKQRWQLQTHGDDDVLLPELGGGEQGGVGTEADVVVADNLQDVVAEAAVQQPVRLVQHQQLHVGRVAYGLVGEQREHAAGRARQDLQPARVALVVLVAEAPDAAAGADAEGLGQVVHLDGALRGELARGGQADAAQEACVGREAAAVAVVEEQLHGGQQEAQRLPRAGGRLDDEVLAGQRQRQDAALHVGQELVPLVLEDLLGAGVEVELVEAFGRQLHIALLGRGIRHDLLLVR
ncbi:uncharacterized protein BcabD6B2_25970 [Babesia caballi]|uniref:Uncharacterized protein n=1 Tax=Babesia caballi TaxID=5871 RepID=A0AAV4LU70_BABCB|nr:hypothetical protein, conserved [Babesia caballi]